MVPRQPPVLRQETWGLSQGEEQGRSVRSSGEEVSQLHWYDQVKKYARKKYNHHFRHKYCKGLAPRKYFFCNNVYILSGYPPRLALAISHVPKC